MTFEDRLYNHWIYTYNLLNIVNDLIYELEERGYSVKPEFYKSGKCFDVIIDPDEVEEVEENITYMIEYQKYYSSLGFVISNNDRISFYIII